MTNIRAEIKGLKSTQRKMEQVARDLRGNAFVGAMKKATLLVQRSAKINAPVDTGRLRASITPEVRTMGKTVFGVVGSNVMYAPYMEKPGNVRRSGRRPYLKPALTENKDKVFKILDGAVGQIVRK